MKYYTFDQNNSGGGFDHDPERGIGALVIIQANSAQEANRKAEDIGIYFDGCESGMDCDCCGDRWSEVDEDDGTPEPSQYGRLIEPGQQAWGTPVYIHLYEGPFRTA